MHQTQLSQRHLQLGSWLQTGSSVIAELADACGFDWLLIDLEHGCGTDSTVLPQIQVIRRAASIVRVGAAQSDYISRALDWGASGIMVPMISTVEQAEGCVRAMRFPPHGNRGLARMTRAFDFGLVTNPVSPLFFAQIETLEGVENARAIAAVEGVDVLFIGPMDLQLSLQCSPQSGTRDYTACLREVAAAAETSGKACGILLSQTDDTSAFQEMGFNHLAIGTDVTLLRDSYQQLLSPLRASDQGLQREVGRARI